MATLSSLSWLPEPTRPSLQAIQVLLVGRLWLARFTSLTRTMLAHYPVHSGNHSLDLWG